MLNMRSKEHLIGGLGGGGGGHAPEIIISHPFHDHALKAALAALLRADSWCGPFAIYSALVFNHCAPHVLPEGVASWQKP